VICTKDLIDKVRETEDKVAETTSTIDELISRLQLQKEKIEHDFTRISEKLQLSKFNSEKVAEFWEQPYAIVNRRPDEWYVIAPTFVDFHIGWLEKTVKGWNYFIVNKFVNWLAQVPKDLKEKFHFEDPLPLKVFDHTLLTGKQHQETAWKRYGKHLLKREGVDKIVVKQGHEFHLIADMINDGILPFVPRPVKEEDLLRVQLPVELRDYQKEAWKKFLQFGAVGVYWPFGSGKTIIGIYALGHIKGPKLIVVPTTTLKEQWVERINQYIPEQAAEIEVSTYHAYDKLKNREFKLVIFDEAHRLPANTFSRLATLRADYRIGLSATPYREDGRTDFIFALTGFPLGMDWRDIIDSGVVGKPTVTLYILPSTQDKMRKLDELLRDDKKTLIYSYWLELGERVAKRFNIPFVYGDTRNRLDILKTAQVAVVSSVGGEGVSLPDLERIIEVGFQFGSRREEAQLMGRLFHSIEKEPEHIILMTDDELEAYEKRLYSIYERGFRINIIR
jgi:DNA excision repair protein ERCC-3